MCRHHRSRPFDKVVCHQHISEDLISSDLTVETSWAAGPGPSHPDPSRVAHRLAGLYFSTLTRLSWGLARARTGVIGPDERGSSGQTTLCLSAAPFLPLITLGPPRTDAGPARATVTYPVTGGMLSRRGTGVLVFEVIFSTDTATFAVRVRDFPSRLAGDCTSLGRRALYKSTQWLLHRLFVTSFLRRAARDIACDPR